MTFIIELSFRVPGNKLVFRRKIAKHIEYFDVPQEELIAEEWAKAQNVELISLHRVWYIDDEDTHIVEIV